MTGHDRREIASREDFGTGRGFETDLIAVHGRRELDLAASGEVDEFGERRPAPTIAARQAMARLHLMALDLFGASRVPPSSEETAYPRRVGS